MKQLISSGAIAEKIQTVAKEIDARFEGRSLTIVIVLKGAIFLGVDLMRALKIPVEIECIRAQSYRGMVSGLLKTYGVDALDIEGKDLLLVDDIFDTGATLSHLQDELNKQNPRSLTTLCLLKKKKEKEGPAPDFVLFEIEDHFVVGYGLDYNESCRNLPGIYVWEANS